MRGRISRTLSWLLAYMQEKYRNWYQWSGPVRIVQVNSYFTLSGRRVLFNVLLDGKVKVPFGFRVNNDGKVLVDLSSEWIFCELIRKEPGLWVPMKEIDLAIENSDLKLWTAANSAGEE